MKYSLPNKKGFTLIELLVVIAIIAVLAVVGIAIFTGQQKNARDARRRADIESIAQAMEAQKVIGSNTYPLMATTYFSSGAMPFDPTNTLSGVTATCPGACQYCYTVAASAISSCPQSGGNYITSTSAPAGWTASATWSVCANLENGTSFCRSNSQ